MALRCDNATSTTNALSTTAEDVAPARPTRRQITVRNLDASIAMYVAFGEDATSSSFTLPAGASQVFIAIGRCSMLAASGTPSAAIMDEYD